MSYIVISKMDNFGLCEPGDNDLHSIQSGHARVVHSGEGVFVKLVECIRY